MGRRVRRSRPAPPSTRQFQATYHRGKRPAPERTARNRFGLLLGGVGLLLILVGSWWFLRIDSIEITGIDDASVANHLDRAARDAFHFQWQVNRQALQELAETSDGAVADINARKLFAQRTLVLDVRAHRPVLAWRSDDDLYVVDATGAIIDRELDETELPVVTDNAGLPVDIGQQVAPRQFVEFALLVAASDLDWTELGIYETTAELHVSLEDGYSVRFATNEDLRQQLANIDRVRQVAADKGDRIERYIDVRLPYKAYYR